MKEQTTVQEESLALRRERAAAQEDAVSAQQVEGRLKAERVQTRLKRMQRWTLKAEGKAIDRVRKFPDALVAASYLAFAALLARNANQPLRVSLVGSSMVLALTGRTKGTDKGITEEVLDLAEQLG